MMPENKTAKVEQSEPEEDTAGEPEKEPKPDQKKTAPKKKTKSKKSEKKYYTPTIINIVILIVIISLITYALYQTGNPSQEKTLLLATTTSTANSGLLDEIIPDFEEKYDCAVKVTPVGTGQALEMGRRGDVYILMVHAPQREQEFVNQGYGTARYLVCYNYFVIIGPSNDPANIKNAQNSSEAMRMIFESQSSYASRGDDSGTHTKEKELWTEAGYDYESEIDIPNNEWYKSVSAGMGTTLIQANELKAYTLSDEGTFWAFEGNLDLEIVLGEDPDLLNQYSVIPINPDKHSHVNYDLSLKFVDWITSQEIQEKIGNFEKNGHQLFIPNAEP
ncbi:MAG: substrate-binding domain-containing protein [Thermoplasmata archaeon]|nr:MAG: substrate-binding domain-containing protein [Thermoplasmata archaeon]